MTYARVPSAVLGKVETRELKLNHLGLYAVLSRHADNETGECWPSRRTLAKECGYRNADDVDRHLQALESAGVITMRKRWCSADDPSDRSFVQSDRHVVPTSTLYKLTDLPATPTRKTPATPTPKTPATVAGKHPPKLYPPELDPLELAAAPEPESPKAAPDDKPMKLGAARLYEEVGGSPEVAAGAMPEWFSNAGLNADDWQQAVTKRLAVGDLRRAIPRARRPAALLRKIIADEPARAEPERRTYESGW
ncbi:hypothetical protein GOEFS_046_00660 [Gordonia effusa NBRC 100432]|uniref:Helix-turn-helix domain-containing protein n=1 Tax=Gordonia effusa NBRC 100432 TaxID=1077974 RepID=H0QZ59_9ACTN|nr:helix-turn-helix domain-containing protein [Gordonia effusa]GAB18110.1 hypothetical protein GOEFS_046_00660 [Gordonia effusa NBRC 100432]